MAVVTSNSATSAGATTLSIARSSLTGLAQGDVLCAFYTNDIGTLANITTSHFTALTSSHNNGTDNHHARAYYRNVGVLGSEPTDYQIGTTVSAGCAMTIVVLRDVTTTGLVESITGQAGGDTSWTCPSLAAGGVGSILVCCATMMPNGAANTWTPPAGMTEYGDAQGGLWPSIGVAALVDPPNPTTVRTFTSTQSTTYLSANGAGFSVLFPSLVNPPIVDASSPADVNSGASNVTSQTTAAFNPPICVLIACTITDGSDRTVTITNNGTAITWIPIEVSIAGASFGTAAAHVAVLTAGRTGMTVTSTLNSADNMALKVYCLTGANAYTPIGGSNKGSQLNAGTSLATTGFSAQKPNSLGFVVGDNFDTVGAPSSTDATEVAWYTAGQIAGLAGYKALGAEGSSSTFNLTATAATADWVWVAFEVIAQTAPVVSAGYSTYQINNVAREYLANEYDGGGLTISARAWSVLSGPNQVGNSLSTARSCTFTPTALGTYVLRYSCTNSLGTTTSDVSVTVIAASGLGDHSDAMEAMFS